MDAPDSKSAPGLSGAPCKRGHVKAKDGWQMAEIGETRRKKVPPKLSARRSKSVAGPRPRCQADAVITATTEAPESLGRAASVVDLTIDAPEARNNVMGPPAAPVTHRAPSGRAARNSAARPDIDREVLLAANSAVCLAVSAASTIVEYAYMAPSTSARASPVHGDGAYVQHEDIPPSGSVPDSLENALDGAIRAFNCSRPNSPACSLVYTAAGSAAAENGCPTTTVSNSAWASPMPTTSVCDISGTL
ncbi:hypothetical protein K1T71_001565 [Dendrolimus kikuchii]|uniref:Uncharacterized protein n=1 Tax=Dendrolimus kikuchii TaxID=765133 RepID=A0ACC1DEE9_9NEOP|nr:hypothetical protein K1T71_001565 [Dendrolimus kikuchii]